MECPSWVKILKCLNDIGKISCYELQALRQWMQTRQINPKPEKGEYMVGRAPGNNSP